MSTPDSARFPHLRNLPRFPGAATPRSRAEQRGDAAAAGVLGFVSALALAGGAWWAGALPAGHRTGSAGPYTAGLVVCLLGLAGLITAWLLIARRPPARGLLLTGVLWQLPFLFAPPIGSRDVYSYACQGWVFARSLDPYAVSPRAADCPWLPGVATLWQDATTPYGAFALLLSGAAATGGSWPVALVVLRLCAVAGLALAAFGVHRLARTFGLDPRRAVWLALPAPLIAIHATSGAHHDALLAGLVLAALALCVDRVPGGRPVVAALVAGVALGLAAAIKITAIAALPFALILAARAGLRRTLPVVAGLFGSFALAGLVSGLGLGWVAALTESTGPKQWTSVPTGVGMAAAYVLRPLGLAAHEDTVLAAARLAGLLALAVVTLVCLRTAWQRRADPRAVVLRAGIVLLALVLFGPVAYPWYFLTPIPVLAAALTRPRHLRWLAFGATFAALLVLPDGLGIPSQTKAVGAFADLLLVVAGAAIAVRRSRRRPSGR
ncbi:hypothetical protein J2S43_003781 [Catenuloplanes nepalensis]|uniref:DUF2029 domain-containing protein n=1 Tax=Catenuloplanes nepalensis TaxID=587533 RepID=A0ABT9MV02_9ACTN|nr:polyprenol phosphomannose-dependent alpha 1,6 mannosyltransferase MptB [Catenuloplanes nepalensis]MDP9795269.1 hypothetical protein [Catenuloplanes nepalensis]